MDGPASSKRVAHENKPSENTIACIKFNEDRSFRLQHFEIGWTLQVALAGIFILSYPRFNGQCIKEFWKEH